MPKLIPMIRAVNIPSGRRHIQVAASAITSIYGRTSSNPEPDGFAACAMVSEGSRSASSEFIYGFVQDEQLLQAKLNELAYAVEDALKG